MRIDLIPVGKSPPDDLNVIIEVPTGGEPVKYEFDKASGALFVDRILHTPMRYPANYGFVPHTLSPDGDPLDALVVSRSPFIPGCVVRARPIAVLNLEDEAGGDEKLVCVPVDSTFPYYTKVDGREDLPEIVGVDAVDEEGHGAAEVDGSTGERPELPGSDVQQVRHALDCAAERVTVECDRGAGASGRRRRTTMGGMLPSHLWYVSYGSNMSRRRLGCYIAGGTPPGSMRTYAGARDRTLPTADHAVTLPGSLYFAGESRTWGGGVAFYDHDSPGETAGRAYLLTIGQFVDVANQEMHRPADPDFVQ